MQIVEYPNPILSQKCADVMVGDCSVLSILDEMLEAMYHKSGVGLAGPQYGVLKKIVVIDLREEPKKVYKLINPKIIWRSEEMVESNEGCLSLPDVRANVLRHLSVSVEYLNENYEKCLIEKANDYLSVCLQHELDHLDGKLFIDRLSKLKRYRLIQKFKKIKKADLRESKYKEECNV